MEGFVPNDYIRGKRPRFLQGNRSNRTNSDFLVPAECLRDISRWKAGKVHTFLVNWSWKHHRNYFEPQDWDFSFIRRQTIFLPPLGKKKKSHVYTHTHTPRTFCLILIWNCYLLHFNYFWSVTFLLMFHIWLWFVLFFSGKMFFYLSQTGSWLVLFHKPEWH